MERLGRCIDRGFEEGKDTRAHIRAHVEKIRQIANMLDPITGSTNQREASFLSLQQTLGQDEDPIRQHMAKTMQSFHPGLFGHQRRIHGHAHAGVRVVQEGPTLIPTLDAHLRHPTPFTHHELRPYAQAEEPACQKEAIHRRTIMRKARSKKYLPALLKELETRYANSS